MNTWQTEIANAVQHLIGPDNWGRYGALGYRRMADEPDLAQWRRELLQVAEDDEIEREPTSEGLTRYPETGGRYRDYACTCADDCPKVCKGQCGCAACREAWVEWDGAGRTEYP